VRVPVRELENAILVPERALGRGQQGFFVLLVGEDNIVEQRKVVPGDRDGEMRIIREGLKPGEQVIVSGQMRARPGSPVAPQPAALEGA
jgi:multidrug efflux pump subunit AcrA (membrane-fusion protein)